MILWQTNIAVEAALIGICILWGLLSTDCLNSVSEIMLNLLRGVYYLILHLLRDCAQKGEFSFTQGAQVHGVR